MNKNQKIVCGTSVGVITIVAIALITVLVTKKVKKAKAANNKTDEETNKE